MTISPAPLRARLLALAAVFGLLSLLVLARPVAAVEALLFAELTGAAEVDAEGNPNQGDPDGSGFSDVFIDSEAGELCYGIFVEGIDPATAAHIHEGAAGVAGPVVVPLTPPSADGVVEDCTTADTALLEAIAANPANYYVNVHNEAFPDGALRGQLQAAPEGECFLHAAVDPDDEGSEELTVTVGQEATVFGFFIPDTEVEITLFFDEEVVLTETETADAEGFIEFGLGFEPGDEGVWTVVAVVPETECAGAVQITVNPAVSAPTPAAPAPTPAPTGPAMLPNTAVDASVDASNALVLSLVALLMVGLAALPALSRSRR